jgi:hypothetical protein
MKVNTELSVEKKVNEDLLRKQKKEREEKNFSQTSIDKLRADLRSEEKHLVAYIVVVICSVNPTVSTGNQKKEEKEEE